MKQELVMGHANKVYELGIHCVAAKYVLRILSVEHKENQFTWYFIRPYLLNFLIQDHHW